MHTDIFDSGNKTIVDCAHVKVERLDTIPVLFSKVFKEVQDPQGQRYDYRYWAERENFFLREFLKKKNEFTRVVQPRHLISENEAAKQVLTCDAGITVANWLRVKPRYADGSVLNHPFRRVDAFLQLMRACLVALRQIHEHRIVHCDIKEDNICLPYAPYPYRGNGQNIRIDFAELKLIDFAFSISHAMPLTQILIINPDDQAPYQSPRLIAALKADRVSGSPNAVQHLDYRVDLFSLGYMAGKIVAGGLECPPGPDGVRCMDGAQELIDTLKGYDAAEDNSSLPHDGLIARIDGLLHVSEGFPGAMEFSVAGEWTAEEMQHGKAGPRKTPLTPVAPPVPTPVAPPLRNVAVSERPPLAGALVPSRVGLGVLLGTVLGLALAVAGGVNFMLRNADESAPVAMAQDPFAATLRRLALQLRGNDDQAFQLAAQELSKLAPGARPVALKLATSIANDNSVVLESRAPRMARQRAWNRLRWMADAGDGTAGGRIAAFEKSYDETKRKVVNSAWWLQGQGAPPDEAARWMENGAILADTGDRPAMLDQAFAEGHGKGITQDRAAAVKTYLKVIARAGAGDDVSTRIRTAAGHGLSATLNEVAAQKDEAAVRSLQPILGPMADSGAADMQYYLGLFDECVAQPPNLDEARRLYVQAEADPGWKSAAEKKLGLIGRWCPGGR
jgi:TPR repeat protein